MKALILSGGKGTRLQPITYTSAKQLVPVANKPVLFYAIEAIVSAGIFDIGIVVGDTHEEVEAVVGDGKRFGSKVRIRYIYQERPLGLAHAVKIAQSFLGDDRFVMFLGDNFIEESIRPMVERFGARDCPVHAQILLTRVRNPQDFGVAQICSLNGHPRGPEISPDHQEVRIVRLVEKPKEPVSDLALVGIYFFDHHIFEAVDAIAPSARGELEITDAIQYLVDNQYSVRAHILTGYWIDTGKMQDMLDANRTILSRMRGHIAESASVDEGSHLYGEVVVEDHAQLINSIVRGPSIIGRHVTLSNAYVGPFTAIDHHSSIVNSEVEHSIVMEGCAICDIDGRIEDSLIGRYVRIQPSTTKPRAYKLLLGDHSTIGIS
jgi:glucose-1-phosphate thymidylyltransferase